MDKRWTAGQDETLKLLYFQGRNLGYIAHALGRSWYAVCARLNTHKSYFGASIEFKPEYLDPNYIEALKALYPHYTPLDLSTCLNRRIQYVKASIAYLAGQKIIKAVFRPGPARGWSPQDYFWLLSNLHKLEIEDLACELNRTVKEIKSLVKKQSLLPPEARYWEESEFQKWTIVQEKEITKPNPELRLATEEELNKIADLYTYFPAEEIARRMDIDKVVTFNAVRELIRKGRLVPNKAKLSYPAGWTNEDFDFFLGNVGLMDTATLAGSINKDIKEVECMVHAHLHRRRFSNTKTLEVLNRALKLREDHSPKQIARKLGKGLRYVESLLSRYDSPEKGNARRRIRLIFAIEIKPGAFRMVNYNPFEPLSSLILDVLKTQGKPYLVVQRFLWPGLEQGKGFVATAYQDLVTAENHLQHLEVNEGKIVDLEDGAATSRLANLLRSDSGFHCFYNSTPNAKWIARLTKAYQSKVFHYIKRIARIKNDGGYEVYVRLEHGRLVGTISSGEVSHEALFYEMIK